MADVFVATSDTIGSFNSFTVQVNCTLFVPIGKEVFTCILIPENINFGKLVAEHAKEWLAISKYLLADACFSKKPFLDQVLQAGMHLICRLRDDSDLKYLHQGKKSRQKVDLNCMQERSI